jgi:microcompartment protein CcmK/EutM
MVPYITFQPNILIYKVGAHTDLGRAIEVADIGVIWHTTYHGNDLNNLTASYGVDLSPFLGRRDIWTIDPHITEQFNISFVKCDEILSIADEILGYINYNSMDRIVDTPLLADIIESVINDGIRKGVEHTPHQLVLNLIHKTAAIHKKEIEELKQKAAKKRALDRYIMISDAIRDIMGDLPAIFQLHDALTRAKLFLINILDARQPFAIRVETEEGYVPCGTEGYVVIHTGNAVKLVNRMEFSRNNFSQDITRGWS